MSKLPSFHHSSSLGVDISTAINFLNSIIWSPALIYLCLLIGVYFTIRTRLLQIRQIPTLIKATFSGESSQDGVSSFQPLAMSLAGRVGTGNIAGVAMAETNLQYLTHSFSPLVRHSLLRTLQLLILVATVIGCINSSGSAWALGDIGVDLMAWLNIVGTLVVQKPALQALKDYERQQKQGLNPVFKPHELNIPNADFWEKKNSRQAENSTTA